MSCAPTTPPACASRSSTCAGLGHTASPCSTAVARRARHRAAARLPHGDAPFAGAGRDRPGRRTHRARRGRGRARRSSPSGPATSGPPPSPPSTTGAPSGFVDVVRQAGLRVPEDVSVVGFDDITEAGYPHVALTTVHQDADRLGAEAVRSLADRLDGDVTDHPAPRRTVIEPELVVRAQHGTDQPGRHDPPARRPPHDGARCRTGRAPAVHQPAGPGRAIAGPRRAPRSRHAPRRHPPRPGTALLHGADGAGARRARTGRHRARPAGFRLEPATGDTSDDPRRGNDRRPLGRDPDGRAPGGRARALDGWAGGPDRRPGPERAPPRLLPRARRDDLRPRAAPPPPAGQGHPVRLP